MKKINKFLIINDNIKLLCSALTIRFIPDGSWGLNSFDFKAEFVFYSIRKKL